MKRLIKLFIGLLIPLLGALTANITASKAVGNLLEKIVGDYKLEVLFVIYTTIFQFIISLIKDIREENTANLEVVFLDSIDSENLKNEQVVALDQDTSVGKIYCTVKFDGNSKHIKNLKIRIEFPNWVEIQGISTDELEIVDFRTCHINCSNMTVRSSDSIENFEHNIKIMMIGRGFNRDDFKSVKITSELVGRVSYIQRIVFKFKTNYFILKS